MTVLVLVAVLLYGIPLALALDARLRGAALAGTAFLLGAGAAGLTLFALSVLRVPWTRTSVLLAMAPLFLLGVRWRGRAEGGSHRTPRSGHPRLRRGLRDLRGLGSAV